jgi:hypothetical protein
MAYFDNTAAAAAQQKSDDEATPAAAASPPFDKLIHTQPHPIDDTIRAQIDAFRAELQSHELYEHHADWADDQQLLRFLIARNFEQPKSLSMIDSALKWR